MRCHFCKRDSLPFYLYMSPGRQIGPRDHNWPSPYIAMNGPILSSASLWDVVSCSTLTSRDEEINFHLLSLSLRNPLGSSSDKATLLCCILLLTGYCAIGNNPRTIKWLVWWFLRQWFPSFNWPTESPLGLQFYTFYRVAGFCENSVAPLISLHHSWGEPWLIFWESQKRIYIFMAGHLWEHVIL